MRSSTFVRSIATLCFVGGFLVSASAAHGDVPAPTAIAQWDGDTLQIHPVEAGGPGVDTAPAGDVRWLGTATGFRSADPAFGCLNGRDLQVYSASSATAGPVVTLESTDLDASCAPSRLTWIAEPSIFLAEKAIRTTKAAGEDGDDEGHAPRIDLWLTDGYGTYAPCTREVLPDATKKYVCRKINYVSRTIPTVSPSVLATVAVDRGEASGGGGYTVYTKDDKRVYEGCDVRNHEWHCAAYATSMSNKSFATSDKWYKNAVDNWASSAGAAAECTAALYNQDAQAIAEDCVPSNYLRWVSP